MNPRKPPGRPGRPTAGPKPARNPSISKNYWRHRRHWPHWRDHCDYDWYDYEYDYDDYDYDYDNYLSPRRSRTTPFSKNWENGETMDEQQMAYQQGFRDGWLAAMEYAMYGCEPTPPAPEPEPIVPFEPTPTPAPAPNGTV